MLSVIAFVNCFSSYVFVYFLNKWNELIIKISKLMDSAMLTEQNGFPKKSTTSIFANFGLAPTLSAYTLIGNCLVPLSHFKLAVM